MASDETFSVKAWTPPVCLACDQPYIVRVCPHQKKFQSVLSLPLLLPCGHTMCSKCVKHSIRQNRITVCWKCKVSYNVKSINHLPRNVYQLGLILDHQLHGDKRFDLRLLHTQRKSVKDPSMARDTSETAFERCSNCKMDAHLVCWDCDEVPYCGACFQTVHQHEDRLHHNKITVASPQIQIHPMSSCTVPAHERVPLEQYCLDDDQRICKLCVRDFHEGHNVIKWCDKFKKSLEEHELTVGEIRKTVRSLKFSEKNIIGFRKDVAVAHDKLIEQLHIRFQDFHTALQLREQCLMEQVEQNQSRRDAVLCNMLKEVQKQYVAQRLLLLEMEKVSQIAPQRYEFVNFLGRLDAVKDLPCYFSSSQIDALGLKYSTEEISFGIASIIVEAPPEELRLRLLDKSDESMMQNLQDEDSDDSIPDLELVCCQRSESSGSVVSRQSPTVKTRSSCRSYHSDMSHREIGIVSAKTAARQCVPSSGLVADYKDRSEQLTHDSVFTASDREVVRVIHIVNPHEFYVLPKREFAASNEMEMKLSRIDVDDLMQVSDVETNDIYLLKQKSGEWRRTRILPEPVEEDTSVASSLPKKRCHVNYIDRGISEELFDHHFYRLPEEIAVYNPFAVRCSLDSIQPVNSTEWSPASIVQFKNYVLGKEVMMTVIGSDADSDVLNVDLGELRTLPAVNIPKLFSIRDTLVYLQLACVSYSHSSVVTSERNRPVSDMNNSNHPLVFYHAACLPKPNETFFAQASWVNSPTDFYVHRVGESNEPLLSLVSEMQLKYAKENHRAESCFLEGMGCVAKFNDGKYYRAKVVGSFQENRVRIFYVDYGNTDDVACQDIYFLLPEFTSLPEMAIHCGLADVVSPVHCVDWPNKSTACFTEFVDNKLLTVHVEACLANKLIVSVDADNVNVNTKLVTKGVAVSTGLLSKASTHSDLEGEVLPRNVKDERFFQTEASVTWVKSPSSIYVQLNKDKSKMLEFMEGLQAKYEKHLPSSNVVWEKGNNCLVLSPDNGKWYRAVIEGIKLDGTQIEVFLVDCGFKFSVSPSKLKEIEDSDCAHKSLIRCCRLSGIVAAGGGSKWPSVATEYLIERLKSASNVVYLSNADEGGDKQHIGEDANDTLPVDLYIKEFIVKGAVDPIITVYRSMAEELLDKGFALPVRSRERSTGLPASSNNKSEDSGASSKENISSENIGLTEHKFPRWLPPTVPRQVGHRFQAVVTYVMDDGLIFMHELKDSERLTLFENTLKAAYENSQVDAQDLYWYPEQACIAQHTNRLWYRGRIVTVPSANSPNLTVHFIDYGNNAQVTVNEVRKNIRLSEYPQIGFACRIFNVQPMQPDGSFTITQLNYMHEQLEDKTVWVTIKDAGDEQSPPAVVIELLDNITLNDLMVTVGFAQPAVENAGGPASIDSCASESRSSDLNYKECIEDVTNAEIPYYGVDEQLAVGSKQKVLVTHVESSTIIYVCKYQKHSKLKKKRNDYKKTMSQAEDWKVIEQPKIGMPCCVKNSNTKTWERGILLDFDEVPQFGTISLVDYGIQESHPLESVKQLPTELLELPKQAIKCKLHHLKPNSGIPEEELCDKLRQAILFSQRKYFIEVKGTDKPIPVELKTAEGKLVYQSLLDNGDYEFE